MQQCVVKPLLLPFEAKIKKESMVILFFLDVCLFGKCVCVCSFVCMCVLVLMRPFMKASERSLCVAMCALVHVHHERLVFGALFLLLLLLLLLLLCVYMSSSKISSSSSSSSSSS